MRSLKLPGARPYLTGWDRRVWNTIAFRQGDHPRTTDSPPPVCAVGLHLRHSRPNSCRARLVILCNRNRHGGSTSFKRAEPPLAQCWREKNLHVGPSSSFNELSARIGTPNPVGRVYLGGMDQARRFFALKPAPPNGRGGSSPGKHERLRVKRRRPPPFGLLLHSMTSWRGQGSRRPRIYREA